MVNLEQLGREIALAAVAQPLLLPERQRCGRFRLCGLQEGGEVAQVDAVGRKVVLGVAGKWSGLLLRYWHFPELAGL